MVKIPYRLKLVLGKVGYAFFKGYMYCSRKKPIVLSADKTVEYILKNKVSVSRYGDGEFLWLFQERKNGNFERNSPELSKDLKRVLNSDSKRVIIGIPGIFNTVSDLKEDPRLVWERFLILYGKRILEILPPQKIFYESRFTRPYMDNKYNEKQLRRKFENIFNIWKDRNVLLVEGAKTRFGVTSNILSNAKSVKRIICPTKNAYEEYDLILETVKRKAKILNDPLVLVSLGPTATILAYDLGINGIQTIDIGHLDVEYHWYKMQAKNKVPIAGTYVQEAKNQFIKDLSKETLIKYKKEIIVDISNSEEKL